MCLVTEIHRAGNFLEKQKLISLLVATWDSLRKKLMNCTKNKHWVFCYTNRNSLIHLRCLVNYSYYEKKSASAYVILISGVIVCLMPDFIGSTFDVELTDVFYFICADFLSWWGVHLFYIIFTDYGKSERSYSKSPTKIIWELARSLSYAYCYLCL